jgi:hypothetical protein
MGKGLKHKSINASITELDNEYEEEGGMRGKY